MEKSRGYSLNTKILTIICKNTSVGRELLHCLMAGRPNKSQSAGQSLIFCLRAGGGSTFLQFFSRVRDISRIRVNGYIFTTADNSRTPCPPGDPTKHEPTTCFNSYVISQV